MKERRTHEVFLTGDEVMAALKAHYSGNLAIVAIPKDATAEIAGERGMKFTWGRDCHATS